MDIHKILDNNPQLKELLNHIKESEIKTSNETSYMYIQKFSEVAPIIHLCKIFGVGKTSYYDWKKRKDLSDPDEEIRDLIVKIRIKKENPNMGYQNITKIIKTEYNMTINHKKVYRIMKKYGLLSISIHSKKMSILYKGIKPYNNMVKRNFDTESKNSIWCIDITKLDSLEGRQYLCAIIDLYDRSIVSCKIHTTQTVKLVKSTIEKALNYENLNQSPKLILHSDQGSVFKSRYLSNYFKNTPLIQSMGKKGTPAENSVIESFFANLKKEFILATLKLILILYLQQ